VALIAVITAALFIALGCDGVRPGEELPLSANFSLPPGESWAGFVWESLAASPLLSMPCTLWRSPGGPEQDVAWTSWEQSSGWTSHSKLTWGFLDPTPGEAPTFAGNTVAWGCLSYVKQAVPSQNLISGTSSACLLTGHQLLLLLGAVGRWQKSAEANQVL